MAIELVVLLVLLSGIVALLATLLIKAYKKHDQLNESLGDLRLEKERLSEKHQYLTSKYGALQKESEQLSMLSNSLEKENYQLALEKGKLENELLHTREKLIFQKQETEKMRGQFQQEFELLANKILEEKSKKFTIQN